jgi:chromosome partitioning protein
MALVLFANTKGGSGKTTAALVLAGELVTHKAKVVLLEGDPNRPLMNWAQARNMPVLETSRSRVKSPQEAGDLIAKAAASDGHGGRLAVVHDDDQEGVFDWIEGASSWAHFVIADPEGSPNEWLTDVASQADLVIIPLFKLDATIDELPGTVINGLATAQRNAAEYVAEVFAILKAQAETETEAA